MSKTTLHGYFRSSASYRLRIALNLKGIEYEGIFHDLRSGQQLETSYLSVNPQGLVPTLVDGGTTLTQSLAICEYLDEIYALPRLLPADPASRARVRAFAQVIACDTHPVQNLKILNRLRELGLSEKQVGAWAAEAIAEGLNACDRLIAGEDGPYCFGRSVTLADICLIPQMVNARRFGVEMRWPRLLTIERNCRGLDAFDHAAPEHQPDAE